MVIENVSSPAASTRSSLRAQDLKLKISTHLIELMTLSCLGVRASGRALFGSVCSRAGKTSWPSRWSQARHACSDGGREHAVSLKLQHKQYMFVFECLYRLEAAGSCGATQTQCSPDCVLHSTHACAKTLEQHAKARKQRARARQHLATCARTFRPFVCVFALHSAGGQAGLLAPGGGQGKSTYRAT